MSNKESIKELKYFKENEYGLSNRTIDLSIEALEKQIPKKGIPFNSGEGHCYIECSSCHTHLDLYYKYCTRCGQKLYWS